MKDYYLALQDIHKFLQPRTYVEVGIGNGKSFQLVSAKTLCIGIDPEADITYPINASSKLFKMTSDEFFNDHNLTDILDGRPVELAFIDGMHLFEYALRDFINLEKYCRKDSCILVHDTLPIDGITSSRERKTRVWTGDVWKLIPCLKKYRPDLNIRTIDVKPSGLSIITDLDPGSNALSQNMARICEEYIPLDYFYIDNRKSDMSSLVSGWNNDIAQVLPRKANGNIKSIKTLLKRAFPAKRHPKCLCVLLCYNDGDILEDIIIHMLKNRHDIIVWDHGSDDRTPEILDKYDSKFIERKLVPRSFDFYDLYPTMSQNLIDNYIMHYDWISWPDDDEILEGPDRTKTYYEHLCDVYRSKYNYIQFNNFNYWFTDEDDRCIESPLKRIKHYALFPDCAARIRSWRASVTNIREFNHNTLNGEKYPENFNLRHYPMRSYDQMIRRINKDRA